MRLQLSKSVRCRLCAEFAVELTSQSDFRVEILPVADRRGNTSYSRSSMTGSRLALYPVKPYSRFKRECEEKHGSFSLANVTFGYINMPRPALPASHLLKILS
jgi:hypothetical protein